MEGHEGKPLLSSSDAIRGQCFESHSRFQSEDTGNAEGHDHAVTAASTITVISTITNTSGRRALKVGIGLLASGVVVMGLASWNQHMPGGDTWTSAGTEDKQEGLQGPADTGSDFHIPGGGAWVSAGDNDKAEGSLHGEVDDESEDPLLSVHTQRKKTKHHGKNSTSWSADTCYPDQVTDPSEYFTCPPGSYLGRSEEEMKEVNNRLRRVYKYLRTDLRYEENKRENISGVSYLDRGYATYESMVWPKPGYCQQLANDSWIHDKWTAWYNHTEIVTSKVHHNYKADNVPSFIDKLVFPSNEFEFHLIWKVASTSFPSYLKCEYDYNVHSASVKEAVPDGYQVVAAVRNPLGRFVSAMDEVLQRAVNGYCPSGYCTAADSYKGNYTLDLYKHQTTWYDLVEHGVDEDDLTTLMHAFIHDVECNYNFYAATHLVTQSAFIYQGSGCQDELDVVLRLEELDEGLNKMADSFNASGTDCEMEDSNSADSKPGGVPSESALMKILENDDEMMKKLCVIYAQDFLCFGYELPAACSDLF